MLYDAYEVQRSWLAGASRLAGLGAGWLSNPANPWSYSSMGPIAAAGLDVFAHASAPRGKPKFGLETTVVEGRTVRVVEEVVLAKPFGQLKHFRRHGVEIEQPEHTGAPEQQRQDCTKNHIHYESFQRERINICYFPV